MPFKKGHKKIKGAGMQVGMKIKKTLEWEQFGKELLEVGLPRAKKIMNSSKDSDFMFYFNNLLEYFRPKLQRTENKIKIENETMSVSLNFDNELKDEIIK